jgi:2'-5' RNA ligase
MRLFTGLDLPAEVVHGLERLIETLRPAARIQWSPAANLHITTKFIGEWPEARLEELKSALAALPARPPLEIGIRELGFFPNPRAPRVFWCGIEAPGLAELAAATDKTASSLGIAAERRPFSAHLTLARIKERLNVEPLRERIAALPSRVFGRFKAGSFFLYQSRLSPGGSVYTKLAEFPLSK